MTLPGADLVALPEGRLEITGAGRHLQALLEARTAAAPGPDVFVSH